MEDDKRYEFKMQLADEIYYNNETYYGIINFYTNNKDLPHTEASIFADKNIGSLVGNMQKIEYGTEYDVVATIKKNPKYGYQYQVKSIISQIPKTIEQQQKFLKSIISTTQANTLLEKYPDIVNKIISNEIIELKDVKGVKNKTFEKIKKKVLDNYIIQDILVLLLPLGIKYKTIVKMLQLEENPILLKKKIIENPYILTKIRGLGFKKVDNIALKLNPKLKNSEERTIAFLKYKLQEISSSKGDTWVNKRILDMEVMDNIRICKDFYDKIIEENEKNPTFLKIDGKMVGLLSLFKKEQNILSKLYDLQKNDTFFENCDIESIKNSIIETEKQQGFEFTDEQRQAIYDSIKNNVIIITSPAGGGKTSVVKGIVNVLKRMTVSEDRAKAKMMNLDDETQQDYIYAYGLRWYENKKLIKNFQQKIDISQVALSACASKRMAQVTNMYATTIHRTLGYDGNGFIYNSTNSLPQDIYIIDEMSMVNINLLWSYIQSIPKGAKLIMVYDFAQLPAIGAGDMSRDLLKSELCIHKFTKVHRQGQKSGILMDANKIRVGENPIKKLSQKITTGELKDMHYIFSNYAEKLESIAIKRFVSASKDIGLDNVVMVTPKKKNGSISCVNLNNEIQDILIPCNNKKIIQKKYGKDIEFREGVKVINKENDYKRNVFNGDIGYINKIDLKEKTFEVTFNDLNNKLTYSFNEIQLFDMAYCLSIHAMQGSQAHTVICIFDTSAYIMLNRKILYTALTRAEKRCLALFQPKALKMCVDDKNNKPRKTWTDKFFNEEIEFNLT